MTTYFNIKDGVILSQTDGENTWYFQYDTNGTLLGFVLNGTQYFYITNQMGDVLAITDTEGSIVGNYEYDAWGKVLTADTDIAKQNPIRYSGYYYDNETGYYYLQSRYYDSNICRFINADIPEIISVSKDTSIESNLFIYCYNNAVNYIDCDGYKAKRTWQIIAEKGVSMTVIKDRMREMKIKKREYEKFKKTNAYCVYQHYETKKWYCNEIYEMYTYGATRAQWYNIMDSFKKGLKKIGFVTKIINSNSFKKLALKVLKLAPKKIRTFIAIVGIAYDFLVNTANGVMDKIEKNIRNLKNSQLYVFNLYVIYKSVTLFGTNRSTLYAYTPNVAFLS